MLFAGITTFVASCYICPANNIWRTHMSPSKNKSQYMDFETKDN